MATQRNSRHRDHAADGREGRERKTKGKTNEEKSVANCKRDQGGEEEEKDEIEEETEAEG